MRKIFEIKFSFGLLLVAYTILLFFRNPTMGDALVVLGLVIGTSASTYMKFLNKKSFPEKTEEISSLEKEVELFRLQKQLIEVKKDLAKADTQKEVKDGHKRVFF